MTDTTHLLVQPGKSTAAAMLLSAALPGAGQVYNGSYWKAPLVFGLGVYFAAEFLSNNRQVEDYRQLYLASLATVENPSYKSLRDAYKDQRDAFAWYFFILYVLNIVDAYVDASLSSFDVSPAISFRGPQGSPGLSLRVSW